VGLNGEGELFSGNVGTSEWLLLIILSEDYGTIRKIAKYI
jgi:hypothetical protein